MKILKALATPACVLLLLGILSLNPLKAVWGPPVTISGTISSNPQIGVDAVGNAVAIWQEFDGVNTNIQAATQAPGGSWSAPVTISSSIGSSVDAVPQIAVDPAGNAVAVWEELTAGLSTVKAATLPFIGGSWSSPIDISVPSTSSSQVPQVAVDPSGNAVAVWVRFDGSNDIIQSASLPFGGSWTSPVDISISGQDAFAPQVSLDPSGNAVAVWANVGIGTDSIQAATLPFGGSWSAQVTLSGTSAAGPQVAVDSAGNAVAVWTINIGPDFFIQAATLPFGGSWSSAVNISTPGFSLFGAQVAVDPAGNAVAVWGKVIGADIIVQAATLPFGGSWSAPVDISPVGAASFDQQVAVDASGNAIAIWDRTIVDTVIQAAMLPFGGSWTLPIDISTAGDTSIIPQIAMTPSGYAVVDWENDSLQVIQSTAWTPPPTITNVNPNHGPTTGGNTVVITGTNFINVTAVNFGANAAISFIVNSPTSITAVVPAGAAGTVDVTVTTTAGTSPITVNDEYTYDLPPSPPPSFTGNIKKNVFLNKTECVLKATFTPSPSPDIVFYRIYSGTTEVAIVPAAGPFVFQTCISCNNASALNFSVTAVNSSGIESAHTPLTIS